MGRKAGGKNFGNMTVETVAQIQATKDERAALPEIYTCIQKYFISIQPELPDKLKFASFVKCNYL